MISAMQRNTVIFKPAQTVLTPAPGAAQFISVGMALC